MSIVKTMTNAITINPGLVLIVAAIGVLAAPRAARSYILAGAALASMWLIFTPEFGAYDAFGQIGMVIVPFALDELNSVFGVAFLTATIFLAVYVDAHASRQECAALALLAGASVAALFVGDFLSFVAAMSLASLAGAWIVYSPEAREGERVVVRMLIWQGLESLLYLAGAAMIVSREAGGAPLTRLDLSTLGGAFVFAGLLIRVAAPLAHVWLRDACVHASGTGAAAISAFPVMLGVYAFARLYGGEAALIPIGVAMIALGAAYAAASEDLRGAGAYALVAQTGVCLVLIGLATPLAYAGAAAHAFTCVLGFVLVQMSLGVLAGAFGGADAQALRGVGRVAPVSSGFALVGALVAVGAPGLAGYASFSVAREAALLSEDWSILAPLLVGVSALAAGFALRMGVILFARAGRRRTGVRTPFSAILAMLLASFVCVAVGAAPGWLFSLTPATALNFEAYAPDRLAAALQLFGAAGAVYALLLAIAPSSEKARGRLLDVDSFYEGPLWRALVQVGGWARVCSAGLSRGLARIMAQAGQGGWKLLAKTDAPYASAGQELLAAALAGALLAAVLSLVLVGFD